MSTAAFVVSWLCGAILLGMIAWIAICLHLAYTRIDGILEHLKNCTAVTDRAPLRDGGPWGKLLLIGGISGIVTFPNFFVKRGEADSSDLQKLPSNIRRKLVFLQWSVWGLIGAMAVFVALSKIIKAYNL